MGRGRGGHGRGLKGHVTELKSFEHAPQKSFVDETEREIVKSETEVEAEEEEGRGEIGPQWGTCLLMDGYPGCASSRRPGNVLSSPLPLGHCNNTATQRATVTVQ